MWIVYNTKNLCIHGRCYSKKAAKERIAQMKKDVPGFRGKDSLGIDKVDLDLMTLDKWKVWKILGS